MITLLSSRHRHPYWSRLFFLTLPIAAARRAASIRPGIGKYVSVTLAILSCFVRFVVNLDGFLFCGGPIQPFFNSLSSRSQELLNASMQMDVVLMWDPRAIPMRNQYQKILLVTESFAEDHIRAKLASNKQLSQDSWWSSLLFKSHGLRKGLWARAS